MAIQLSFVPSTRAMGIPLSDVSATALELTLNLFLLPRLIPCTLRLEQVNDRPFGFAGCRTRIKVCATHVFYGGLGGCRLSKCMSIYVGIRKHSHDVIRSWRTPLFEDDTKHTVHGL